MPYFWHGPNQRGNWRDTDGNRFQIFSEESKESAGYGMSTTKADGITALRVKPLLNFDTEALYAAAVGITEVTSTAAATTAASVSFDNTGTGMAATEVNSGLVELDARLDAIDLVDNGDGSFTHTDGNGVSVTFNADGVYDWTAATVYAANETVLNGGQLYRRVAAGTSGATFDAAEEANWVAVTAGATTSNLTSNYVVGDAVAIGDLTYVSGSLYAATSAHTYADGPEGATDAANWELVTTASSETNLASTFTVGDNVVTGDLQYVGGALYVANADHVYVDGPNGATDGANWDSVVPESPHLAEDWVTGTAYVVNEVVVESSKLYRATAAHTASALFATDAANWEALTADATHIVEDWSAATAYLANEVVAESGQLYRRNADGNSGALFDATEQLDWTLLDAEMTAATTLAAGTGGDVPAPAADSQNKFLRGDATFSSSVPEWVTGTQYEVDDVVRDGAVMYYANTAHAASALFATDTANWTALTAEAVHLVDDWAATTAYDTNEVVVESGQLYRRNAAGTSGATFDATELLDWTLLDAEMTAAATGAAGTGGDVPAPAATEQNAFLRGDATFGSAIPAWANAVNYEIGDIVRDSDQIYVATAASTPSSAAFATDVANWTMLAPDLIVDMVGATSTADGAAGTVPQPLTDQQNQFLRADGTFGPSIPAWAIGITYEIGDVVRDGNEIFVANAAHTSAVTLQSQIANWDQISVTEDFTAADTTNPGVAGGVPAPAQDEQNQFLRGDATFGPSIPEWVTGTVYEVDDIVRESDQIYRATLQHTASALFATDTANWTQLAVSSVTDFTGSATTGDVGVAGGVPKPADDTQNSFLRGDATFGSSIPAWSAGVNYEIGDVVYNPLDSNKIYAANAASTPSSALFATDIANWDQLSAGSSFVDFTGAATTGDVGVSGGVPKPSDDQQNQFLRGDATFGSSIPEWATGVNYEIGDIVRESGLIYAATAASTPASALFATDVANWTQLAGGAVADMTGSTSTAAGVGGGVPAPNVNTQNLFLRGDATFGSSIPEWVTATDYEIGDIVRESDQLYRNTLAHTSSALFATDEANWTILATQYLNSRGGWSPNTNYEVGDVVTERIGDQYFTLYCVTAHTSNTGGDALDDGAWLRLSQYSWPQGSHYNSADDIDSGRHQDSVDTSGGAFTLTLPDMGSTIYNQQTDITLMDSASSFGTNNLTVTCGGTDTFVDGSTSYVCDENDASYRFVFNAIQDEWSVFPNVSAVYADFVGAATTGDVGVAGLVPKPADDTQNQFLRADATFGSSIPEWATAVNYEIGDVVRESDKIYYANAASTPASALFATDVANWTELSETEPLGDLGFWSTANAYEVGDLVRATVDDNDFVLYCQTAHTSAGANWLASDSANWFFWQSQRRAFVSTRTADYTITGGGDYTITVDTASVGAFTLTLPDMGAATENGRTLIKVIDVGGALSTANLTVVTSGADTFADGTTSKTFDVDNGTYMLPFDPNNDIWGLVSAGGSVSDMTAATTLAAGTAGSVPAPGADSQNSFLRGDATFSSSIPAWAAGVNYEIGDIVYNPLDSNKIFAANAASAPSSALFTTDAAKWDQLSSGSSFVDFTGAATTGDVGVSGGVPKPSDDQQNQFLRGDATFGSSIPAWATGVNYEIGDVVRESDKVYYANAASTPASAAFATDVANWTQLSAASAEPVAITFLNTDWTSAATDTIALTPAKHTLTDVASVEVYDGNELVLIQTTNDFAGTITLTTTAGNAFTGRAYLVPGPASTVSF